MPFYQIAVRILWGIFIFHFNKKGDTKKGRTGDKMPPANITVKW